MIQANELRIGNAVNLEGLDCKLNKTTLIAIINGSYDNLNPIPLTEEILLKCGGYQLPHFTVMNTFYFDLGRNRELSIDCVGTPNLMVFIQEIEKDENGKSIKVEDIICVHNWDYDGGLYLHQLQNLYFLLTQKELNITL